MRTFLPRFPKFRFLVGYLLGIFDVDNLPMFPPGRSNGVGAPDDLEERADPECTPELVNRAHQAHCGEHWGYFIFTLFPDKTPPP